MKTLSHSFALLFILFSSLSYSAVDSKKIKAVSKELAKLLPGTNEYKVKPGSPIDMMKGR